MRITDRSRAALAAADPGDRLYAIDENGDAWLVIIERAVTATSPALVHRKIDGPRDARFELCDLHADLDREGMAFVWVDDADEENREHVVGVPVLIEGWS